MVCVSMLGACVNVFYREIQTVNLKDVFGTEGKSDLGFFPRPYTSLTNT